MSESQETMQNLMWRQGQSGLGSHATDIYGDANDNKSLFNVRSQPVIAHWVEWFGRPDSCNYPSVFCQAGRGAESTSIRLANVLSLIPSYSSEMFLWFREGQESTQPVAFALPTADMSLEMFPILDFLYPLGNVGALGLWTDLFVHSFSTQVHVQFLQWLRATNVLDWGQTFKHYSLLHYVHLSAQSIIYASLWTVSEGTDCSCSEFCAQHALLVLFAK